MFVFILDNYTYHHDNLVISTLWKRKFSFMGVDCQLAIYMMSWTNSHLLSASFVSSQEIYPCWSLKSRWALAVRIVTSQIYKLGTWKIY